MNKNILFIMIFLSLIISGCINNDRQDSSVCIKDSCFEVELAVTQEERGNGLIGRNKLDADKGMLFIFEEEDMHSFWMKDMKFAIDIIWINADKEIVYISSHMQPCEILQSCPSITPLGEAKYVLEIKAGEAYGFKTGDTATFSGDF